MCVEGPSAKWGWLLTDSSWDTDSDGDANSVDIEGKAAVEGLPGASRFAGKGQALSWL